MLNTFAVHLTSLVTIVQNRVNEVRRRGSVIWECVWYPFNIKLPTTSLLLAGAVLPFVKMLVRLTPLRIMRSRQNKLGYNLRR
jgi:hypothetical protein